MIYGKASRAARYVHMAKDRISVLRYKFRHGIDDRAREMVHDEVLWLGALTIFTPPDCCRAANVIVLMTSMALVQLCDKFLSITRSVTTGTLRIHHPQEAHGFLG